jgi:BirA family biotin operon repressor/biotin-[acetyl-CoA-carboxylase] ligase
MSIPAELAPTALRARLAAVHLCTEIVVLDRATSTMDLLAARARAGAPEGSVVIADYQTAGRGRLDRVWIAPPGSSLMLSVLFRPHPRRLPPERNGEIPMAMALGALDALNPRLPPDRPAALKWPNDLVVGGAKLGGILAEVVSGVGRDAGAGIVVGIGINVRQSAAELPPDAASLASLSGVITSGTRADLAVELLEAVDRHYAALLGGDRLIDRWAARLETLGRKVVARQGDTLIRGRAIGVTEDGALRISTADGAVVVIHAGDVTLAAR